MTDWFKQWFGEDYLAVYAHRDTEDARELLALLQDVLPWRTGWRILDVGCGPGRHAEALEEPGHRAPVGVDLSMALLRRAKDRTQGPLIRADMRALPIRSASFDLTVNLFTSFGYFRDDHEHAGALREMVRTVRPGGWYVIDYLNPNAVIDRLEPHEVTYVEGSEVTIHRSITEDARYVVKQFLLQDGRVFEERVRLFAAAELEAMLESAGASVVHRFGDYRGGILDSQAPRALLLAQVRPC